MKPLLGVLSVVLLLLCCSCAGSKKNSTVNVLARPSASGVPDKNESDPESPATTPVSKATFLTTRPLDIGRREFVDYAKRFLGTPYKYGSADPAKGFDCSGLLYYVFQHYQVKPPRTSAAYGNVGETISLDNALPGDLILFRGENSRNIGHIGIITANKGTLSFLHAAGSNTGVIISTFSGYYKKQFVKVIRVLK
ncbi:C40 family peptidase [Niabella beijingensis]|uniref:C40 family peptidase n=1 Tax=Niabella beijingensis TaxID=2872700 RepID=UPI001CBE8B8F|nr:C40 family peptidase [Niabella beijingensis]MBZ4189976.1 C40 family peptidase [Niabella beijingensis]